jgi:hypothetical protein
MLSTLSGTAAEDIGLDCHDNQALRTNGSELIMRNRRPSRP